jgi:KaiC/GvpD/RAD55 family RecA-like ATPase
MSRPGPGDASQRSPAAAFLEPVDLDQLFAQGPPAVDWLVEPVIPRGRVVSLDSTRGAGKSLLALDLATAVASGGNPLGRPSQPPEHVLYVDQEMSPADLYERLDTLGYGPARARWDALVGHLHYMQLVDLPPLDTAAGGSALDGLVERWGAALVILDTVARVISGEENSSDTFRALDQHTTRRLRRRGVTTLRLDHLGKDPTRGTRGSSAKQDTADVVWEMSRGGDQLVLKLQKGRQVWLPTSVLIRIDLTGDLLHHMLVPDAIPRDVIVLAGILDQLGVDPDAPTTVAQQALREAGTGRRRSLIVAAQRHRRMAGNRPGNRPQGTVPGTEAEPLGTKAEPLGTADGNCSPPLKGEQLPGRARIEMSEAEAVRAHSATLPTQPWDPATLPEPDKAGRIAGRLVALTTEKAAT